MPFCSPQQRRCKRTSLAAALQFVAGGDPFCRFLRARNRDRCSIPKQGPLIHKCIVRSRNRDRFPATKQGPKRAPKRVPTLEPAICFGWHSCAATARSPAVGRTGSGVRFPEAFRGLRCKLARTLEAAGHPDGSAAWSIIETWNT